MKIAAWEVNHKAPNSRVFLTTYFPDEERAKDFAAALNPDRMATVKCKRTPDGTFSIPRFSAFHTIKDGFINIGTLDSVTGRATSTFCTPENEEGARQNFERIQAQRNGCMMEYERFR